MASDKIGFAEMIGMTTRTTNTIVFFSKPFVLPGFDAPEPAGDYRIDYDEEMIEGRTHVAWRRTATYIHLPAIGKARSMQQMVPIDPTALDAALKSDRRPPLLQ
eukprot:TRINITY_DN18769_c0_g1_i5.p4 TRINITY_DN18769_c0_g1~~TRINITY_DN18769_c0_g1_i5.p4  ORF type:complete len:104 (-),score=12.74 TRINITY_DN18769_c0_g1_i5:465-776(-)